MLIELIKRIKKTSEKKKNIFATPSLSVFLSNEISKEEFLNNSDLLEVYTKLDDNDVWGSMKYWVESNDFVIRELSQMLLQRKLLGIQFFNDKIDTYTYNQFLEKAQIHLNISRKKSKSFVVKGTVSNAAYVSSDKSINILKKNGEVVDVADASDLPNIKAMSKIVKKHYLCAPKSLYI
jgi:hypothetical protein